jgi:beta-N-acetylhexosaminidase
MASRAVEKPENVAEANRVAERSITLLRNEDAVFPLSKERKVLFVVVAADDDPVEGATLTPEIARRVPDAKIVRLDPRSTPEDYEKVVTEAANFNEILLAPFVKRAAAKGTVALPENQAAFVKKMIALAGKKVGVVAFGNPYMIRQFPEARNYAVAYAIEDVAQTAAARVLFGETKFQGKLPVTIPGLFEIGAGLTR